MQIHLIAPPFLCKSTERITIPGGGIKRCRTVKGLTVHVRRAGTTQRWFPLPPVAGASPQDNSWFLGYGLYELRAAYVNLPNGIEVGFPVHRDDVRIDINLWVMNRTNENALSGTNEPPYDPALASVQLRSFRPAPAGLVLRREWAPGEPKLKYRFVNKTGRLIYSASAMGSFWGVVEVWDGTSWVNQRRGSFCGTGAHPSGELKDFGGSAESIEGYFIGAPITLPPGRYRYTVPVSDSPLPYGVAEKDVKANKPSIRHAVIYQIFDEFRVPGGQ